MSNLGKLTEDMAVMISCDGMSYLFDGHTYCLTTDPEPVAGGYSACAVRVGDAIDDSGYVDDYEVYWNELSPKELGYRTDWSTALEKVWYGLEPNSKGSYTLKELDNIFGHASVMDDGDYVLIEPPVQDEDITHATAIRLHDELDNDGDIIVYDVSWFKPDDEILDSEIRHGMDERQVVLFGDARFVLNDIDSVSYRAFLDREWCVLPEDACDWDHPSSIEKNDCVELPDNVLDELSKETKRKNPQVR